MMKRPLPPGLDAARFDRALAAFARVVGSAWIMQEAEERTAYHDLYAIGTREQHAPSAAIAPASVEELQAVVRLANEHGVPLWPISRGKNYGYGGAAPRLAGSVILDLGRMRRILEVDVERAYAVVEPGVGFFDIYNYFTEQDIPLWCPMPGNSVGSLIGNALEHGVGYGPQGDRGSNVCGMEVVLPSGELVRTGLGAMPQSDSWHLFRYGYGPGWDQMFMQSSLGVVTRMGCWMQPEPALARELHMQVPEEEDIGWLVETLSPLCLSGVIRGPVNIGNFMRYVMGSSQRSDWYQGDDAIPDTVLEQIRRQKGFGYWPLSIMLYGEPEMVEASTQVIRRALARHTDQTLQARDWRRGEPRPPYPQFGVPISFPLRIANWLSANGGHLSFSPVIPAERNAVVEQFRRSKRLFQEHGFDLYCAFTLGERHINVVQMLTYDQDDPTMIDRAHALFRALIRDAEQHGYGEYRTHLAYMDAVADTYSFNNHAMRRLNEAVKDALDPNGILAPGKQGIWPARYRHLRGT